MVIDEIVLHNFGIFGGRQRIALNPPSRSQPVILFGGLNGAGKTTLLEGIQLALFGKLAPPAREAGGGYETYLTRSIHRAARPKDGAAVEVAFRSTGDGQETHYRVRRSWAVKRRNLAERVDVEVNGARDASLSETWSDQVHRFFPPQLAELFLFDGERIEALADPDQSERFLSVAIDALLGMDLVRQLETDLSVLERRKRAQSLSSEAREKYESENATLRALNEQIRCKKEDIGSIRNAIDRLTIERDRLDADYRQQGGDLLERKEIMEGERSEAQTGLAQSRRALVELAYGMLPLALVESQLKEVLNQAHQETVTAGEANDLDCLKRHRSNMAEALSSLSAAVEATRALDAYIENLETQVHTDNTHPQYLGFSPGSHETVSQLIETHLPAEQDRARCLLRELEQQQERVDEIERKLVAVPEADAIQAVAIRREDVLRQLQESQQKLETKKRELEELEGQRERQQERVERLLKETASEELNEERRSRLLEHSAQARQTLETFRQAALERNLERLQGLILECYQSLLRKASLVHRIAIDPARYRLSLYDGEGEIIPSNRLSAGERQLLAVATLWGLARASGRPLPVVVDTPLGRLDGQHRRHLVTRYFPEAAHQVLLLSTDQEIVEAYLDQMRPWIGRMYRIEYNEETRSSYIEEGYFEEVAAA